MRSETGSVRAAAGLGGPSLTRSAVAVHAAVVTLYSTVQNVLDVLNYQVNGHCRKHEGGWHRYDTFDYLGETQMQSLCWVFSCTYQDCRRHVVLSHLHISLSVRNTATVIKHNMQLPSMFKSALQHLSQHIFSLMPYQALIVKTIL